MSEITPPVDPRPSIPDAGSSGAPETGTPLETLELGGPPLDDVLRAMGGLAAREGPTTDERMTLGGGLSRRLGELATGSSAEDTERVSSRDLTGEALHRIAQRNSGLGNYAYGRGDAIVRRGLLRRRVRVALDGSLSVPTAKASLRRRAATHLHPTARGRSHARVRARQQRLTRQVGNDTIYGQSTGWEVRKFQKRNLLMPHRWLRGFKSRVPANRFNSLDERDRRGRVDAEYNRLKKKHEGSK